jgi:hypothetical protein
MDGGLPTEAEAFDDGGVARILAEDVESRLGRQQHQRLIALVARARQRRECLVDIADPGPCTRPVETRAVPLR